MGPSLTFLASIALARLGLGSLGVLFLLGAFGEGLYALIWPGVKLLRDPRPEVALQLFNKASFYPMVMLPILIVSIAVHALIGV